MTDGRFQTGFYAKKKTLTPEELKKAERLFLQLGWRIRTIASMMNINQVYIRRALNHKGIKVRYIEEQNSHFRPEPDMHLE